MGYTDTLNRMSKVLGYDFSDLGGIFDQMEWAEEEIEAAIRRHPTKSDELYHSFKLLRTDNERMATEFVFRGHCRELLERVAAGKDTRPGTAAEVVLACAETSKLAPFNTAGVGLYMRMWLQAFPYTPAFEVLDHASYENVASLLIDEMEAEMRRKLSVQDRVPFNDECAGRHHGVEVNCKFKAQELKAA